MIHARSPSNQSPGHPDQLIADERDDTRLTPSRTGHHFGYPECGQWFTRESVLFPDGDDRVEVVVVEVAQAPWVHEVMSSVVDEPRHRPFGGFVRVENV